ncbi:DNA glycosylase [Anaeromyces robustus]|uniref:Adenine DNA glycosylase n=1 Tax=Anaeromyces robustus TaxID=1754192 RepID=A0A1Y1X8U4_9FUNG|nr:DNA glycosylase [Anaeromyces robustus]|eukprot:ORX82152.1 DNA glycosylase [Anaeromyces robustus]
MGKENKKSKNLERLILRATEKIQNKNIHEQSYHEFEKEEIIEIRKAILEWYDENRRILPWRVHEINKKNQNSQRAYEVWISEVMLQQTQVATVVSYYKNWISKWPTVFDLAKANIEDVNKVWAGLGYYARANRLLQSSKLIVEKFNGEFPRDAKSLEKEIPGVGKYTAGAISSIAFGLPAEVVDGNVIRIISRLRGVGGDVKKSNVINYFWKLSKDLLDTKRPGHFNQALMDIGSSICTPKSYSCYECPIKNYCVAYAEKLANAKVSNLFNKRKRNENINSIHDIEECDICIPNINFYNEYDVSSYPIKVKKEAVKQEYYLVMLFEMTDINSSQFLISKRPNKGLLAGLWEFPNVLIKIKKPKTIKSKKKNDNDEDDILDIDMKTKHRTIESYLKKINLDFNNVIEQRYLGKTKHIFSHIHHYYYVEYIKLDKLEKKMKNFKDEEYIEAIQKIKKESIDNEDYEKPSKKIKTENTHINIKKENNMKKSITDLNIKWIQKNEISKSAIPTGMKRAFSLLK